ncbi:DNA-directed RNA polymerase subunit beta [Marinilactibacillus sp. GCM10026970]|uniref:DNA-directed RNA polymerase subunit beta n=1 Tax=Marinilactibacillus sp. GCM10026970 TaxID=3252642 RepID=UPI00360AC24A
MTWQSVLKKTGLYLLKIIIVLILITAAFIGGVMIGYGVIGDGNSSMDVFEPELWQHILEFIL